MTDYQNELFLKASELFRELGLTSLRIKDDSVQIEIELKKEVPAPVVAAAPAVQSVAAPAPANTEVPTEQKDKSSGLDAIKAPLVGVFYAAPTPDQPAFVKAGDQVKKGDILCIIEAMKMMNEITADRDCVIEEVCAENGKLVEFGQMLFKVRN
ncbi:MAG: acetyl-CoA carboxylase biotin carboxyl carrier protein [Eubacteriales bacterium]